MKSRTTLILLLLAIIGAVVVYWDYKKGIPTEERVAKRKRLVQLKSDAVTRIEVTRSNVTIVAEKVGDRWQLKQPLEYRGSTATINSILSEVEFAEVNRFLGEQEVSPEDLRGFGLAEPVIRAQFDTKQGSIRLHIGHPTPTKDAVYVQVVGQKVVAITRHFLAERLATEFAEWRERDLFDTAANAVTRLEIRTADRLLELAKSAATTNTEPRWAIVKPAPFRADQRKVDDLVRDLTGLRAEQFLSDDEKDVHIYGLAEPVSQVTISVGEKSKTLLIGQALTNDTQKVAAKLKGTTTVVAISADAAAKLALQPNDLRDAQIVGELGTTVKEIEIVRGNQQIVVAQDTNSNWHVTAPTLMTADASSVQNLLRGLSALTATQFVTDVAADLDMYGLTEPSAAVIWRGAETNLLLHLLIGGSDSSNTIRYVKRTDEPFVYGVNTNIMSLLPVSAVLLRTKTVGTLNPAEVTKVTRRQAGLTVVVEKGADGKWQLVEPKEGVLHNDALDQLLQAACRITAEEYVATSFPGEPEIEIGLMVGEKTYTLRLSPEVKGDRHVAWSDPPLVFLVADYNVPALTRAIVTPASSAGSPPAP